MPDTLGNITVPEPPFTAVNFPIISEYPHGLALPFQVAKHHFGSGNNKIVQAFLLGTGARHWTVKRQDLSQTEVSDLYTFWEARTGPYGEFLYQSPNDDGAGTTQYRARFANEPLSVERLAGLVASVGITLIEVPTTSPTYTLSSTVLRFPAGALETALLSQVQEMIPLVKIIPRASGYPAIYISDRRCTIGAQLWQARLLTWDGIGQFLGNEADQARFTLGNADRVMRDLVADVDLRRARVEFSAFHVGTTTKIDIWAGEIIDWSGDSGPEFGISAYDGIYEVRQQAPDREISRTCWKAFNDGFWCPYSTQGSLDLVNFPSASAASCDNGFWTPNGCAAHNMERYHGGIQAEPQDVRIRDNSTGTWGLGRDLVTSRSLVAPSIYDSFLPLIYTDTPMPVVGLLAAGRDESEFYDALAIVGQGPLVFGTGHKLDGQYHHGYPGPLGLRTVTGTDPAGATEFFSLGQSGNQVGSDPRKVFSGGSTYLNQFAAGVAFLELRKADEKGIQLTRLDEHSVEAVIAQGIQGWAWTGAGARSTVTLTNPFWVAVDLLLRCIGQRQADASTAESYFDVSSAVASAAIANLSVTKLVGSGSETQFKYRGIIKDPRPLRDWISDVLSNCLGYFTFVFGKLKLGIRSNSSVVEVFTEGNIVSGSLTYSPIQSTFNHLTVSFGDEEYGYQSNAVVYFDLDHAKLIGTATGPKWLKGTINLPGCTSKSQALRVAMVKCREELGGINADEWKRAYQGAFKTTVLALNTEPGKVCSFSSVLDFPGGSGEWRCSGWKLLPDWSIDVQWRTTTDSMYDPVVGPKPVDVTASPIPVEFWPQPLRQVWHPNEEAPNVNDPIYDENDKTFGITQRYETLADGTKRAEFIVTGKLPITEFILNAQPPQVGAAVPSTAGGILRFLAVCARSGANYTPPSNIVAAAVSSESDTINLTGIVWPAGSYDGYVVFGADDQKRMCAQLEVTAALPASITGISATFKRSTWNMPTTTFERIRIKAKNVPHAGVIGTQVSAVGANTITCAELATLADNWTGRVVMIIADRSDGSSPVLNYSVTAYNSTTGQFTCSPDPQAAGVEVGDVLIVGARATAAGANYIEDSGLINGLAPLGLTADVEEGNLVRIIAGPGRGQVRRITSNTGVRCTVDTDWDIIPDSNSWWQVEVGGWEFEAETSVTPVSRNDISTNIGLSSENLLRETTMVMAVGIDRNGNEAPEDYFSPFRLIYLYGEPPSVRTVTADTTAFFSDETILGDTTAGNIVVNLLPVATMEGRTLNIKKISADANTVTVQPAAGDTIDGAANAVLENQWDSIQIVGGQ